jgi:hypothetical protein
MRLPLDGKHPELLAKQALMLQKIEQALYWLDCTFAAYPDAVGDSPVDMLALRASDSERPALAVWKELLSWHQVDDLTAGRELFEKRRAGR